MLQPKSEAIIFHPMLPFKSSWFSNLRQLTKHPNSLWMCWSLRCLFFFLLQAAVMSCQSPRSRNLCTCWQYVRAGVNWHRRPVRPLMRCTRGDRRSLQTPITASINNISSLEFTTSRGGTTLRQNLIQYLDQGRTLWLFSSDACWRIHANCHKVV